MHLYIYIYIYVHTERLREKEVWKDTVGDIGELSSDQIWTPAGFSVKVWALSRKSEVKTERENKEREILTDQRVHIKFSK